VEQRWSAPPLQRSRFCSTAPPAPPPIGGARWWWSKRTRLGDTRAGRSPYSVTAVTLRALPLRSAFGQFRRMNKLAPIEHEPKPAKPRKVSRRCRHAIDLLISGQCKTQKDAAEKAGLTRERFCRALKERHVIEYLDGQTRVLLAQSRAPAAAMLMTLLQQARSEHVRKDVAVTLLGYSGFHATGDRGPLVSIGIGAGPGYIIDLSGKHGDANEFPTEIGPAGGVRWGRDEATVIDVSPTEADQPSAKPARKPWENGHE
jgi:hypothetical protein